MVYFMKYNYPVIRNRITPIITQTKSDLKETAGFYTGNAKHGWQLGQNIANQKKLDPITTFLVKTYKAISKTRIRGKDVTPLIGATIFSATPFLGTGLIGFALGKALNPKITQGLTILKKFISRIRIK